MRQFRKKAIAICLASALTVLGAFSAENYKNSLVSLKINKGSGGQVSLTAFTRENFEQPLTTEKVDQNSYSVILPETYSEVSSMPNITGYGNIDSIIISTYPYTPTNKGYTAIHIKTKGNPTISANTSLYIADKNSAAKLKQNNLDTIQKTPQPAVSYWDKLESNKNKGTVYKTEEKYLQNDEQSASETSNDNEEKFDNSQNEQFNLNYDDAPVGNPMERLALLIGAIVLSLLIFFIYFMSKDKMATVVGEKQEFSLEDENENKDNELSKRKKIKSAIKNLDKKYVSQFSLNNEIPQNDNNKKEDTTKSVVVDLDSLYNEKNKEIDTSKEDASSELNDDLSDFLKDFSFDDIQDIEEDSVEENKLFEEELYERIINNDQIYFSKQDTAKLLSLMQNEISEDTIENIEIYAPKGIKQDFGSYITHLENILAEYTIKQNIMFKKDDVDAILKLMNVELDKSFITDLRTDSNRTKAMSEEIKKQSFKQKNVTEPSVLKVKDFLPDLSVELKKQGNKPIKSDAKAEVIYQSEGYDFSVLSLNDDSLDISKAINQNTDNSYRPSDALKVAEDGYDVQTLSIKEDYPDLVNVKESIKKYNIEPSKTKKADTKILLKSLTNVTFKPFYEEPSDSINSVNREKGDIIPEEKIVQTENIIQTESSVFPEPNKETELPTIISSESVLKKKEKAKITPKINDNTAKLMAIIEDQQNERKNKQHKTEIELQTKKQVLADEKNDIKDTEKICIINGHTYNIIKNIECTQNLNLCLAKDDKEYIVAGKSDEKFIDLKHYDSLRTENIQTRKNDINPDGSLQYLVRVSIHKFVINVTENSMEFVMDLC